jgi:hypothetical protein
MVTYDGCRKYKKGEKKKISNIPIPQRLALKDYCCHVREFFSSCFQCILKTQLYHKGSHATYIGLNFTLIVSITACLL